MPELIAGPRKQAPQAAPSIAGSVNPNMFSGESDALQRMGATISRAGNQFQDVLMRRRYADYANQYNEGQLAYQQFESDSEVRRTGDTNYDNHAVKFDQEYKQWSGDYLAKVKDPRARNELSTDLAIKADKEELKIFNSSRANVIQKIRLDQPAFRKIFAQEYLDIANDDDEVVDRTRKEMEGKYRAHTNEHERLGMAAPGWAEEDMHLLALDVAMEAIERDPEITKQVMESGDLGVLMSDNLVQRLTSADKDEIRTAAKRKGNYLQLMWNQDEETKKAEYQLEAANIAETGDIKKLNDYLKTCFTDRVLFSNKTTVADWRGAELGKGDRRQAILKEGKPNPYTTITDPETYWKNYTKVLANPNSMTNTEITAMVPGICGITQAQSVLNLKKSPDDDPLKSPQAQMYFASLGNLVIGGEKQPKAELALYYDKAYRALADHITKYPDETPEQLNKYYNSLIEPFVKDWRPKNWGKLISGLPGKEGTSFTKTATNPKTGKKVGWNGTKWIPIP